MDQFQFITQKLYIASDHAAWDMKQALIKESFDQVELSWVDLGPSSKEQVDYPDYGQKMAETLKTESKNGQAYGVLLCGSGIGISIAANRYPHVRAALCRSPYAAMLARKHNDSNVLCLGARITAQEYAKAILQTFLTTAASKQPRHLSRVKKLESLPHK